MEYFPQTLYKHKTFVLNEPIRQQLWKVPCFGFQKLPLMKR